ncbi:MAG: ADP-glyceromanno-heptose 6-epimerase [Bacteroidota bacterium]|nr:ADP-glyceromanno-heptose 6-epimerase [Bacteroidota bacterium]
MIVVTGSAGFIGSCMVAKLNQEGFNDVVLVDDFSNPDKNKNFEGKTFSQKVDRSKFIEWIGENHKFIQMIIHLGARTDTTEFDREILNKLNLEYTKQVFNACTEYGISLIYASSAATYGLGEFGYNDDHDVVYKLKPLNPYGESKNEFDKWALQQPHKPYFWAGLKFFNVYGPNEYHKGRMASVIMHAFNQIKATEKMKLFRSHNPDFKDGEQLRDFVYVKDVVDVIFFLMNHRKDSGIYNLGTGNARSFLDLTRNTFKAMGIPEDISFVDTPADIRDKYQYFTEANMAKLRSIGFTKPFTSLEAGVEDYVKNYLTNGKYM